MLFNSFEFLLFFPIVTLIYFLLPHKFRWFHLLVASCFFYMAFVPIYILILLGTIVIDYIAGLLIENAEGVRRKAFLVMSIVANVGVLAFFKYYNFFTENVNLLGAGLPLLRIVLPIGLSFHTFQAMSYTIEVYRRNQKPEKHFGIYALYVMFYPQLVAGPIERPQNILHQFHEKQEFNYDNCIEGLKFMLWGFFKKIVIADRLALIVNNVYKTPEHFSPVALVIATVFFAFQIYFDFSGYSDIAIGAAKVMGIKLMANFNNPYSAKSISEFWRKWHISLSTWLSDYIFTPIAVRFRNYGLFAVVCAALVTFLVSGFWHGAAWKYVVWGLLHGLAIAYEVVTKNGRKKLFKRMPDKFGKMLSHFLTFSYVCFCYVFFRANNISDAFFIIKKTSGIFSQVAHAVSHYSLHGLLSTTKATITAMGGADTLYGSFNIMIGILLIIFMNYVQKNNNNEYKIRTAKMPAIWKWGVYCFLIVSILVVGVYNNQEFIYFQF